MNTITEDLMRKAEALKAVLHQAPRAIGTIAVNHFKDNFRKQGFDNFSVYPWPPRINKKAADIGRAILIKSGRLKNSLRITLATTERVVIGTDVPYARIHNEGGTIQHHSRSETFKRNRKGNKFVKGVTSGQGSTYKSYVTKMPKREYMGDSENLNIKVDKWYIKSIDKALKQ